MNLPSRIRSSSSARLQLNLGPGRTDSLHEDHASMDGPAPHEGDITHEEDGHRGVFTYLRDGRRLAKLTYSRANASLVIIDHTEVDPALAGQGVGRRLLDAAVSWARDSHVKVIATCPFAAAQFARDPGLRDVLA